MFNPNPPKLPAATSDFWTPDEKYDSSVPFPLKEAAKLTHAKHKFFQVFEIGLTTGPYNALTIVPGLTVGSIQTINVDQIPDWWTIGISSETASRVFIWLGGEPSAFPIRLGSGGSVTIPAQGNSFLTIQCRVATATAFGTIIAHAGFDEKVVGGYVPA